MQGALMRAKAKEISHLVNLVNGLLMSRILQSGPRKCS